MFCLSTNLSLWFSFKTWINISLRSSLAVPNMCQNHLFTKEILYRIYNKYLRSVSEFKWKGIFFVFILIRSAASKHFNVLLLWIKVDIRIRNRLALIKIKIIHRLRDSHLKLKLWYGRILRSYTRLMTLKGRYDSGHVMFKEMSKSEKWGQRYLLVMTEDDLDKK